MNSKEPKPTNHLIHEKSPYLLQHAHNPVDWYPWCDEAFQKARSEDKPILLSIGYSTCHWCHVMETESFEDEAVARLLNEGFVCIKVDREERPDIDRTYMAVCQMMTGRGGWPLTIVMTPEKTPFFAATYIPKSSRYGLAGLLELLPRLLNVWKERRDDIKQTGEEILFSLSQDSESRRIKLDESVLHTAYRTLFNQFDTAHGGFGSAPKFPMSQYITFLLRYYIRFQEEQALSMAQKTLDAMRRGGIWDHVGFGFHRYSTDQYWHVPHFEKMLYDQALLTMAYSEAFQVTQNPEYKKTAEHILEYVLRDMTSPEGAFYTAEDADSEGEEGKFYLWSVSELQEVVDAFEEIQTVFSLNSKKSLTETGEDKIILRREKPLSEVATILEITEDELIHLMERERNQLFNKREQRIHPSKDDKILTDWNGLMIAAFAKAAQVFDNERFSQAAQNAARFLISEMKNNMLYHRFRHGEKAIPGFLDDYAFFVWGLLELYETTFEPYYLQQAISLTDYLVEHFSDPQGGFYHTSDQEDHILVRQQDAFDGSLPAGNSVALMNVLRLSRITGSSEYEEKAAALLDQFSASVSQTPCSHAFLLQGVDFILGPAYEVVIVGDPHAEDTTEMIHAVQHPFIPHTVLIVTPEGDASISSLSPYTADLTSIEGKPTCYVCQNYICNLPTTDIQIMLQQLGIQK
jgi:hypothetical protein